MTVAEEILDLLRASGIPFDHETHAPAYHIEDCAEIAARMGATVCKNFFLKNKSGRLYALLLTRPEAKLVTSDISKQAGTPRLMFAGEEPLNRLLRAYPGAVSPLGLLFDTENQVRFLMDRGLTALPRLAFHPCDNTQTVSMTAEDFLAKFLPLTRHDVAFVDIHDFWRMNDRNSYRTVDAGSGRGGVSAFDARLCFRSEPYAVDDEPAERVD